MAHSKPLPGLSRAMAASASMPKVKSPLRSYMSKSQIFSNASLVAAKAALPETNEDSPSIPPPPPPASAETAASARVVVGLNRPLSSIVFDSLKSVVIGTPKASQNVASIGSAGTPSIARSQTVHGAAKPFRPPPPIPASPESPLVDTLNIEPVASTVMTLTTPEKVWMKSQ